MDGGNRLEGKVKERKDGKRDCFGFWGGREDEKGGGVRAIHFLRMIIFCCNLLPLKSLATLVFYIHLRSLRALHYPLSIL